MVIGLLPDGSQILQGLEPMFTVCAVKEPLAKSSMAFCTQPSAKAKLIFFDSLSKMLKRKKNPAVLKVKTMATKIAAMMMMEIKATKPCSLLPLNFWFMAVYFRKYLVVEKSWLKEAPLGVVMLRVKLAVTDSGFTPLPV